MKLDNAARNVEATGILETNQFSIEMNAASIDILSSKIYSNAYLAIVRELACNAWDAHVAAGTTQTPFEVWFPSELKREFKIRDYGTGLSHDDVMYLYTTYFGSNKRDTNTMIGGLGLGSKTPYAYTSAFSVRSFKDGTLNEYAAYKNEHGIPTVALVSTSDTDQPNGIEIAVPVAAGDDYKFRGAAQKALEWFPTTPTTHGFTLEPVDWETKLDSGGMRKNGDRYGSGVVVMGNVAYALNMNILSKHTTFNRGLSSLAKSARFVLFAEIGELTISASREELNYTEATINRLIDKLDAIHTKFVEHVTKGIEDETTLAGKYYWWSKLPDAIQEVISVQNVVELPAGIAARAVDSSTWTHETGIKTTTCSHLTMRGKKHPAILIAEKKSVAFKKIITENDEFHPLNKSINRYGNRQADRDVYVLWRPSETDKLGAFANFLENFDQDYVFYSSNYAAQARPKVTKAAGTYVKPATKVRKLYTAETLPVGKGAVHWNETNRALDQLDSEKYVLVGFRAFEAVNYAADAQYTCALIQAANALCTTEIRFLGVPRAAWKTATKQKFLTLDQFVQKRIKEFSAELTKETYVLATQRPELKRAYPLLAKFLDHSSTWATHAPGTLVHAICERFALLVPDYMQDRGLEHKINRIEAFTGEKLFDLTEADQNMYAKELKGAEEWLNWAYPKLVTYLNRSSWSRIDELAGHYVNCLEGINE